MDSSSVVSSSLLYPSVFDRVGPSVRRVWGFIVCSGEDEGGLNLRPQDVGIPSYEASVISQCVWGLEVAKDRFVRRCRNRAIYALWKWSPIDWDRGTGFALLSFCLSWILSSFACSYSALSFMFYLFFSHPNCTISSQSSTFSPNLPIFHFPLEKTRSLIDTNQTWCLS